MVRRDVEQDGDAGMPARRQVDLVGRHLEHVSVLARRQPRLVEPRQAAVAAKRRLAAGGLQRSEERRVGTEGVSPCSSRWAPAYIKKKQHSNDQILTQGI